MKVVKYFLKFSDEENYKLDVIRRFFKINENHLRIIATKIEWDMKLSYIDKSVLKSMGYNQKIFSTHLIKEWINLTYAYVQTTMQFALIQLTDSSNDALEMLLMSINRAIWRFKQIWKN